MHTFYRDCFSAPPGAMLQVELSEKYDIGRLFRCAPYKFAFVAALVLI